MKTILISMVLAISTTAFADQGVKAKHEIRYTGLGNYRCEGHNCDKFNADQKEKRNQRDESYRDREDRRIREIGERARGNNDYDYQR